MSNFIPSDEQQVIFDTHKNTRVNLALRALAGTGKTTTLMELAKTLPPRQSAIYCAFNKDIVGDVRPRLQGTNMTARTFHSLGLYGLKKHLGIQEMDVQPGKYREIVKAWAESSTPLAQAIRAEVDAEAETMRLTDDERQALAGQFMKDAINCAVALAGMLRLKLTAWNDTATLRSLVDHYGMDDTYSPAIVAAIVDGIPQVMAAAEKQVREQASIDYTDMIYWAVRWNVRLYQYFHVFVDECQDLSPMQRAMVDKIIYAKGGRVVIVGDPNQAIYEFAGADSDSFDLSVAQWNAQVLPLTLTRRCSQAVTENAAGIVEDFHCLDDAPQGQVIYVPEAKMVTETAPGDMVLCRLNAPLIEGCLEHIAANKPATVLGKGIGAALIQILEKVEALKGFTWDTLGDKLTEHEDRVVAKRLAKDDEAAAESYRDQCKAVRVIMDRHGEDYPLGNMNTLKSYIEDLFSDEAGDNMVVFSTVHKAKGREADRVWILKPDRLPLEFEGMRDETRQQERNLDYVARTRAKTTLGYFTNKNFAAPPQAAPQVESVEAAPQVEPEPLAALPEPSPVMDLETGLISESVEITADQWDALKEAHPAFRATGDLNADLKAFDQTPRQRLEAKLATLTNPQVEALLAIVEAFN